MTAPAVSPNLKAVSQPNFARLTLNKKMAALAAASFLSLGLIVAYPAQAGPSVPPPFDGHIYDPTHNLIKGGRAPLEEVLAEHERLTGDKIVVALFPSLSGENAEAFTQRLFAAWPLTQRRSDRLLILSVFLKERRASAQAGLAFDDKLSPEILGRQTQVVLPAGVRKKNLGLAVGVAIQEILSELESPLIQSGQLDRTFQDLRAGDLDLSEPGSGSWGFWAIAGILLITAVGLHIGSAEAHYSAAGWFRPYILGLSLHLRSKRREQTFAGGGFFGSW